jgi:ferritin-like protein
MASETLHEDPAKLDPLTVDKHRAISSLMEELEAVDWYAQRVDAAGDAELKAILAHNRDEEKEHAMMVLEWLRRHDSVIDEMIKTYVNSTGPIVAVEAGATGNGAAPAPEADAGDGSLGIGSLKGENGRA